MQAETLPRAQQEVLTICLLDLPLPQAADQVAQSTEIEPVQELVPTQVLLLEME